MKHLTTQKIDPEAVLQSVADSSAGATALFVGTVRAESEAGEVDLIHYEAYEAMAERKLVEIEAEVRSGWPVRKVTLLHRLGDLRVGEVSVAVGVSSPHRAEAFDACRHAIERIKHDVPIWKKERLAGGKEVWVDGTPIGTKPRRRRAR